MKLVRTGPAKCESPSQLKNNQNKIKSKMDEIKNDRPNLVGHAEQEAPAETGGLVLKALLNAANTRNAGDGRGYGQRRSLGGSR